MDDFHVTALDAAQALFNGAEQSSPEHLNSLADSLQAKLRANYEFASVGLNIDAIAEVVTVMIDRAPESVDGFEGQTERLYVNYTILEGGGLKYKSSRPE